MVSSKSIWGLITQIALVVASPNPLKGRDACGHDNCLRALLNTAHPGGAVATSDCRSFLQRTVTPCSAPTTTTTVTATVTADAPTTTVVDVETVTSPQTTVLTVAFTTTDATQYVTTVTTQAVQPTISLLSSTTVTSVSNSVTVIHTTVSVFSAVPSPGTGGNKQRRDENLLDARDTSNCVTGLVIPTAVPTYASACSGTVRYSSACSCISAVVLATVTVSLPTVTSTSTSTVTVTPDLATATSTAYTTVSPTVEVTSSQEIDVTATKVVDVIVTTTLPPVTVYTATAVFTVVTVSSITVTAPGPTVYCQFNIQVMGSSQSGKYFFASNQDASATLSDSKTTFQLDTQGRLLIEDGDRQGNHIQSFPNQQYLYVNLPTDQDAAGYIAVQCIVIGDLHQLSCNNNVWSVGNIGNTGPYVWLSTISAASSSFFNAFARPINCLPGPAGQN